MNIYELYGRLVEEKERTVEAFNRTVALLSELKSGQRTLDEVEVLAEGWRLKEEVKE